MADYGTDAGGFPLSSLEAAGDNAKRKGWQRRLNDVDPAELFPTGEELERRRAILKAQCIALGWEFVEATP